MNMFMKCEVPLFIYLYLMISATNGTKCCITRKVFIAKADFDLANEFNNSYHISQPIGQ